MFRLATACIRHWWSSYVFLSWLCSLHWPQAQTKQLNTQHSIHISNYFPCYYAVFCGTLHLKSSSHLVNWIPNCSRISTRMFHLMHIFFLRNYKLENAALLFEHSSRRTASHFGWCSNAVLEKPSQIVTRFSLGRSSKLPRLQRKKM
jgi:hypothetical protein